MHAEQSDLIDIAVKLGANCHRLYKKAGPVQKRLLNQLFFEKVYIHHGDNGHHIHAHTNEWVLTFRATDTVYSDNCNPDHRISEEYTKEGLSSK